MEGGEGCGAVLGAEEEMAFCVVGFQLYGIISALACCLLFFSFFSPSFLFSLACWDITDSCTYYKGKKKRIQLTFGIQSPGYMMYLWIAGGKVAKPRTPRHHLAHKLLLCRLVLGERPQER